MGAFFYAQDLGLKSCYSLISMNAFRLTGVQRLGPELRLERYHELGYEIEVKRDGDEVTVILEMEKEGYHTEIVFACPEDAEAWNRGSDSIKPKRAETKRTCLAYVIEPIITKQQPKEEEKPHEPISGPGRVVEV